MELKRIAASFAILCLPCFSIQSSCAIEPEIQSSFKQIVQTLNKIGERDPCLKDCLRKKEFEGGLDRVKKLGKELLHEKRGAEVIALTNQLWLTACVEMGMKGDVELGLLYLDALEHLERDWDGYVRVLYFSAKRCNEKKPRDLSQSLYFRERLESTKTRYHKVLYFEP